MKKIALILAALTIGLAATAQGLPKNEFNIELFGGYQGIYYSVGDAMAYNHSIDPQFAGFGKNSSMFPKGGGAGFGYTAHFNDWIGLHFGVLASYYAGCYKSAMLYLGDVYNDVTTDFVTMDGQMQVSLDPKKTDWFTFQKAVAFEEKQHLLQLQVPVMLMFTAPLSKARNNFFYLAAGAKVGFNILGSYEQTAEKMYWSKSVNPAGANLPDQPMESADRLLQRANGEFSISYKGGYQENEYPIDLMIKAGLADSEDAFHGDGKIKMKLVQVLASAEMGFRWKLSDALGLYTGFYFDYGFLPINEEGHHNPLYSKTTKNAMITQNQGNIINEQEGFDFDKHTQSVLNSSYISSADKVLDKEANDYVTSYEEHRLTSAANNMGFGIKIRFAFGKVKKAAPAPVIEYRTDTVVRTVHIRDTVNRTVVKKDTVTVEKTNTVVIRDTVTIIKEVPVEIQKTMMELSNTMFDFDKSVIKEVAKEPLNKVVKWLQENPDLKVEISGHTDNKGSRAYNQRLSEARAKAVYDYFVSQGVNKFRLAYAGYGFDKPIATNDTEEGRQMNRRVELNIVE